MDKGIGRTLLRNHTIKTNNIKTENYRLAYQLNEKYKETLLKGNVHFRASINSLSLISISEDRPELGVKCSLSKFKASNDIEALIKESLIKINLKSISENKPEKKLQAWIINDALTHQHQLPFNRDIKFITSELAIKDEEGKVVTDILGFNVATNQLCVIELKSDRLLTRLIEQVNNFEKIINKNPEFFSELLAIHSYKWQNELPNSVCKIVVWPHKITTSKKIDLDSNKILEYTYQKDNKAYKF